MVLKRRLPSQMMQDIKQENKENPADNNAPPAPAANPFEAQQALHNHSDAPAPAAPENKTVDPFAAPDPFTAAPAAEPKPLDVPKPASAAFEALPEDDNTAAQAPVAPLPENDASASAIPEAAPAADDPFAANDPFKIPEKSVASWDEEPETPEQPAPAATPTAAPAHDTPWQPEQTDFSAMADKLQKKAAEKSHDTAKTAPKIAGAQPPAANAKTALIGAVAVCAIGAVSYTLFFKEKDETSEVVSRWTGALQEVSEELPEAVADDGSLIVSDSTPKAAPALIPETVVNMAELTETTAAEPPSQLLEEQAFQGASQAVDAENPVILITEESEAPQTEIAFIDEPNSATSGENIPEMPREVGVIAQMQRAIMAAREQKEGQTPSTQPQATPEPEPVAADVPRTNNADLSAQLEAELAEYRRILAGEDLSVSTDQPIRPREFFGNTINNTDVIPVPRPQRESALLSQEEASNLYGENPYNLPVIPEPTAAPNTVRTLNDFDAEIFQPAREKVRVPRNITPTLKATTFPPVVILSMIPGRGIIAEHNKTQGVLMLGESIEGWELIAVYDAYAQFKRGKRTHNLPIK